MTLPQILHTTILEDVLVAPPNPEKGSKKKKGKRKAKVKFSTPEFKSFPQFSRFPDKIQRRILECIFYHDTSTGPALALVSRKVNGWIRPLIYEYIVIDRFNRISPRPDRLWKTFSNNLKSKEFFRNQVKGILVNGMVDPIVTDLLSVCTKIDSFSCYAQGPIPDTILEKLAFILQTEEFPNLRHLSVSGIGFDPEDILRPYFQNLTHLAVDIGDHYGCFPWQGLETHSCLTHILVDMHFELHPNSPQEFKSAILHIISHAPSTLRCLIVLVDWDKLYESFYQKTCDRSIFSDTISGKLDKRVLVAAHTGDREEIDVMVVGEDPVQFLEYVGYVVLAPNDTVPWICPPNGLQRGIWDRAEHVLQRRNAR